MIHEGVGNSAELDSLNWALDVLLDVINEVVEDSLKLGSLYWGLEELLDMINEGVEDFTTVNKSGKNKNKNCIK